MVYLLLKDYEILQEAIKINSKFRFLITIVVDGFVLSCNSLDKKGRSAARRIVIKCEIRFSSSFTMDVFWVDENVFTFI